MQLCGGELSDRSLRQIVQSGDSPQESSVGLLSKDGELSARFPFWANRNVGVTFSLATC